MSSKIHPLHPDLTGVCITCRLLRTRFGWIGRIATDEEFKILGRVICPICSPNSHQKALMML